MMSSFPFVSVIIPTYNRKDFLGRTLASLAQQAYPADLFEVIVVDDGSTDDIGEIAKKAYPFTFKYIRQSNQGVTCARNHGAKVCQGNILVFLDDDIVLAPQSLNALTNAIQQRKNTIVIGTLQVSETIANGSTFARIHSSSARRIALDPTIVPFVECQTGLLAVRREDFLELGMFQDPTNGWPNWDDVDFGYRAYRQGYKIIRCPQAIGEHWDYALADLKTACNRWYQASKSAVRLFQKYPEIQPHLPMFHDKTPVAWCQDPPRLIARKLARHVASSRPALWTLEQTAHILEQHYPSPSLLRPLYRWVIGGYIFRGYREGLRKYGPVPQQTDRSWKNV